MEQTAIAIAAAEPAPFKVTVSAAELAAALKRARKIASGRDPIQVLSNVLLRVAGGALEIVAINLDLQTVERIAIVGECLCEGAAVAVPAVALYDAARANGADMIELEEQGGRLQFRRGRAQLCFEVRPATDFPALHAPTPVAAFNLDAATLRSDLNRVGAAMSKEETRYYLKGVLCHVDDGALVLAATDGHRLARIRRPLPDGAADLPDSIFPSAAVNYLKAAIGAKETGTARLVFGKTRASVTVGALSLTARLIEGRFPAYRLAMPAPTSNVLSVPAPALGSAFAAVAGTGNTALARLSLTGAGAVADSTSTGAYAARAIADAVYEGEETAIGLDGTFVADAVKAFGPAVLDIAVVGGVAPVLFSSGDCPELTMVIMPLQSGIDRPILKPSDLEAPSPSLFAAWPAMPGRARDLSEIETCAGTDPGPRKATAREVEAYARDLAARAGLQAFERVTIHLEKRRATFGAIVEEAHMADIEEIDWERIGAPTTRREYREARYEVGAYCIAFPGRIERAPVLETLDEAGAVASSEVLTETKKGLVIDRKAIAAAVGSVPKATAKPKRRQSAKASPAASTEPLQHEKAQRPASPDLDAPEDAPAAPCAAGEAVSPEPAATDSAPPPSDEALAAILAELKALRAEVAELRQGAATDRTSAEIDRLKRENAALSGKRPTTARRVQALRQRARHAAAVTSEQAQAARLSLEDALAAAVGRTERAEARARVLERRLAQNKTHAGLAALAQIRYGRPAEYVPLGFAI